VTLGATLVTSFLATLAQPRTWPIALAAFVVRGGVVVLVAPILVIPSAVGVANAVGPALTSFVLGGWSPALIAAAAATSAGLLVWILAGGLVVAAMEVELIRMVAEDEEVAAATGGRPVPGAPGSAAAVFGVRLVASLPVALALAWSGTRLVSVAYAELTLPSETGMPAVLRVVRGAPEAVAVLVIAWLVTGMVGSVAARYVVLAGAGVGSALRRALGWLGRHPIRALVAEVVPLVCLVAVLVPAVAAATASWDAVGAALAGGAGPVAGIGLLLLFVALWLGGVTLVAAMAAWRAAAWTVVTAGTFGASPAGRPGDWNSSSESGTLADLRPRGADQDAR
jgi:hypothetical protein